MMLSRFGGVFLPSALLAVVCAPNDLGKAESDLVGRIFTESKLISQLDRSAVSADSSSGNAFGDAGWADTHVSK